MKFLLDTFYHGDAMDILPQVSDDVAKLVFTSPPGFHQTSFFSGRKVDQFYEFLRSVVKQLARITCANGFIVISQRNSKANSAVVDVRTAYINTFNGLGYRLLTEKIILQQSVGTINLRNHTYQHFLVFTEKGAVSQSSLHGDYLLDVLLCDDGVKVHGQTVWTPRFVKMVVETFTTKGDLVVDPFAGVGVVFHVARALGRRCLAVELDDKFYNSGYKTELGLGFTR